MFNEPTVPNEVDIKLELIRLVISTMYGYGGREDLEAVNLEGKRVVEEATKLFNFVMGKGL